MSLPRREINERIRNQALARGLVSERELAAAGEPGADEDLADLLLGKGLIREADMATLKAAAVPGPPADGPGGVPASQQETLEFGSSDFFDVGQEKTRLLSDDTEVDLSEDSEPVAADAMDSAEFSLTPSFSESGPVPAFDEAQTQVMPDPVSEQEDSKVQLAEDHDSGPALQSSELNLKPNLSTPSPVEKPALEKTVPEDPSQAETIMTPEAREANEVSQAQTQLADEHLAATQVDSLPPTEPLSPPGAQDSVDSPASTGSLVTQVSRSREMTQGDLERVQRVVSGAGESLLGVNLGGYRIDGRIGSGGMGDVYEATQLSLDRKVALKVLPAQFSNSEEFIERFYSEARTLGTFVHSNVVQVYDVDEAAGLHFFTMEKVPGHSFKDLLDDSETIAPEVCTNLLKQTIRGLSRAQKAGVIHRDLKPGNVLISDQGDVKVVDFGLAQRVDEKGEFMSKSVVGTPLYISPEAVTGDPLTFKSDMYSLGATFFHLLTGKPPYRGKTAMSTANMHVNKPVPAVSDVNTAVPAGLSAIISRMMAKSPGERYGSYKELFDAVEEFELRAGIIKSRSDFLSDSLMSIGDHGIRGIWNKIGFMTIVGGALAVLALGVHNVLQSQAMHDWIALTGDVGTILFALAVLFITYVALARKRIVPVIGSIRGWMYAHIVSAIASFFLVSIHSGNYFAWFKRQGARLNQYPDRAIGDVVPHVAFLNSFVFLVVIVSGLVGATIWRDILKQVTVERIQRGQEGEVDDSRLTLSVFSQTVFKYWRMLHYPLAVSLGLLTLLHVISILYYRGL